MTADVAAAFEAHEAYKRTGETFQLTTTAFGGQVRFQETDGYAIAYELTVRAPMLSSATDDEVGAAVEDGWFDTYALRLEDAAGSVRDSVDVEYEVHEEAGDAVATFRFEWGNPDRAAAIAKALAEYTEGTYVEGIVPGYDYQEPVSSLVSSASHGEGQGPPL